MKLEDQVVSLELAKKLKELGVKQESLYYYVDEELRLGIADYKLAFERMEVMLSECQVGASPIEINGKFVVGNQFSVEQERRLTVSEIPQRTYSSQMAYNDHYSAFTVAELGEMLRNCDCDYRLDIDTYKTYRASIDMGYEIVDFDSDKEADARAKLLIHLIEEGIIKTNGVITNRLSD